MNSTLMKKIPALSLSYGLSAAIGLSLDLHQQKGLALNSSRLISASDTCNVLFDYLTPCFLDDSTF